MKVRDFYGILEKLSRHEDDKVKDFIEVINRILDELDDLDDYEVMGAEGWKAYFGIE